MVEKSTHLQGIPLKTTQTQQISHYRHATNISGLFLLYDTDAGFNSRKNFANLGFFANVSVLLQFIIPC